MKKRKRTLVGGAICESSSSGIITGQGSPASRNMCSVSRLRPFSRIKVLMFCAVDVASNTSSTPLTNVTVICGARCSLPRLTSTSHAGFDSFAFRELHWARNSIHDAARGSNALNSIFTLDRNFNIVMLESVSENPKPVNAETKLNQDGEQNIRGLSFWEPWV